MGKSELPEPIASLVDHPASLPNVVAVTLGARQLSKGISRTANGIPACT